jgi:hypothetical protein
MRQLLEFGLFHGDPHPGNVFAMGDGRIAYVDFGSVAEISEMNKQVCVYIYIHMCVCVCVCACVCVCMYVCMYIYIYIYIYIYCICGFWFCCRDKRDE